MTFKPGASGNPNGRPKGAISKRTQLAKLLEPHAEELINKAVELAKAGDIQALRFCLERLIPKPKDEGVELHLTDCDFNSSEGLLKFSNRILTAASNGEISPEQAQKLFNIVQVQGNVIYLERINPRLDELEEKLKNISKNRW